MESSAHIVGATAASPALRRHQRSALDRTFNRFMSPPMTDVVMNIRATRASPLRKGMQATARPRYSLGPFGYPAAVIPAGLFREPCPETRADGTVELEHA